MKKLLKRTCVLLLVFAMFMSMCSNVFATKLLDGDNGKEIYLSWSYYKYDEQSDSLSPVTSLDSTADTYIARLSYSNNPTNLEDVMYSFDLVGEVNHEIVTGITDKSNVYQVTGEGSVGYTFVGNYTDGHILVTGATDSGFVKTKGNGTKESIPSAGLFNVSFKILKAVNESELKNLFRVAVNENSFIHDKNGKSFTIVELPHFTASVKTGADILYTSSNAEKIASNLTGKIISADGMETTVTSGITVELNGELQPGKNTVTAKYDGYTCDVDIEVSPDTMTGISIENQPQLEYTSGATLNLDALVVKGTWASGHSRELAKTEYTTSPVAGTKLKVADNGSKIKITANGLEAETDALTVSHANISGATIAAIEPQEYTGEQIKPEPTVTAADGTTLLEVNKDYTVEWGNNTTVAEGGSVTINGIGEYTDSKTVHFTITQATSPLTLKVNNSTEPQSIKYRNTITFTDGNGLTLGVYSDAETKVQFKPFTAEDTAYTQFVYANHSALPVGDYSFRAVRAESANVGPATSNVVKVTITPKPITEVDIEIDPQTYTGSAIEPDIKATIGMITLVKGTDYTLSDYQNNTDVTTEASVKVTGKDNYTGERTVTFTIKPQWLSVTASNFLQLKDGVESVTYTGLPITPKVDDSITVGTNNPIMLTKDVDYTVEYESNINAGTAKITIKSKTGSNYTFDEFTVDFTINPVKIKINSSQYDWVPYVDGDKIKGYDSDGGGQQSPYFDYDGKEHGIKLQFKDDARVNEIKLETLVKCTYTNAVNTNASGYTAYVTLKLNKDYETNYQLLGSSDTPVPDRTLTKTWSIHKATLTNLTPPDLNIRCLELAGAKPVDYTYSLDWLGTGVKPNNLKITLKGLNCTGDPSYDNDTNTITFPQVTAKTAGTPTDSVELELGFTNYESIRVTIPVKYINKLSVSDKLSMDKIEVVYGDSYAPVLKLDSTTVTPKTLTYTDENGNTVANAKNAGTYTIKATYEDDTEETVEGVTYPGHIGEKTATLTIKKRPLTADVKHAAITYGEAVDVNDCTVTFGNLVPGESLTMGTDFTVSTNYKTGDDVGDEYGFFINLQGVAANNYTVPTVTGTLTVNPKPLTAAMVEDVTAGLTYNGNEQKPTVTVKDGEKTLTSGTDYTLTYKNNTNAGTATVTVEGKGNYTGKVEKDFTIAKATPVLELTGAATPVTYTGARYNQVQVNNPSNVEVTYHYYSDADCKQTADPINAGTYYVKISFAGDDNYNAVTPDTVKSFTIEKANHPISITAASATYTGAAYSETNITVTPTCEVTFTYYASETGNEPITRPTDVGTYWVVASYAGTDNYNSSTSARVSFSITKATPPTPAEVKVDGEDKTLKDLEDSMRKDLGAIEGEFTWRDSDGKELPSNTKIEANKEYEWTFTPTGKDAKNYRPISGKTTPYVRDDLSWLPGVLGGGSTFNFRDVTRYDYFYNAVKWAAENGIASGTSRYTFSPDAVCTRAQTVTFLWRAAGSPMPSYRISPFTDVNYGDYYYNAVLWAVEQGITTGLTATTFGPDKTVTRGQVAMFLYRAASAVKPNITNSFTDVKSTAYNYDAILWAYDNRITTGTSTTTFSPDAFCTRAQIVTFLYRFYQGR